MKCVPWLPSAPSAKKSLDLVPVRVAMAAPVVVLREAMRIEDLRQVLRDARHNGFPVVRDTPSGQVLACFLSPISKRQRFLQFFILAWCPGTCHALHAIRAGPLARSFMCMVHLLSSCVSITVWTTIYL